MNWKYSSFFIVPIVGAVSILANGLWTFSAVVLSFGLIPLVELCLKPNHDNLTAERKRSESNEKLLNWLLFLVMPCYLLLLLLFLQRIRSLDYSNLEYFGVVMSFGMMCGIMAINVGHELGHRHVAFERFLGETLLILSLQSHFLPYHNHGHHRNVATPNDPATARKNEAVFIFWFRSQLGSYFSAWRIEWQRLRNKGKSPLTFSNRMIRYSVFQLVLITIIFLAYSTSVLFAFLLSCFIGMLLLETVNYIEHYGLVREHLEAERYERVTPAHSWNSDHILGRVLLFELSRHSDHHANPSKHYYHLDSYQQSPQMPTGYPGMMLLSLFPPLWFKIMNRKLAQLEGLN